MGLFDQFPYTNFHELNLTWILEALKEIQTTIEQFVAINALKYANPIQWNIVKQYEKNTIVIDPLTGTAYISVQPVPTGVQLYNTDYWTKVFDLGAFVVRAAKNFTTRYEEETTTAATFNSVAGDWLVWGDTLYRANVNITAGDSYVEGGNIQRITVEEVKNAIYTIIGDLEDLDTEDKSNLVAAINEVASQVLGKIGDLEDLDTEDKSNLVAAINEVASQVLGKIGDLEDLDTEDKSNLVAAINEIVSRIININAPTQFNTVAEMIASNMTSGIAITAGYYTANDGGGASYLINDVSGSGYDTIALDSGYYAHLIINGNYINIKQLGAKADNTTDVSAIIQYAIDTYHYVYVPAGNYYVGSLIDVGYQVPFGMKGEGQSSILRGEDILRIHSRANMLTTVSNIRFVNEVDTTVGTALMLGYQGEGVGNLTIKECYFEHCNVAIGINPSTNVNSLHIEDCYFWENTANDILLFNENCTPNGIYIDGCHFQGQREGAISLRVASGEAINITNCIFECGTRANVTFIRTGSCKNVYMENIYCEILGDSTTANNKCIILSECSYVDINTLHLSGNVGGQRFGTGRSAIDITLCHHVNINHVDYGHNLLNQLISVSGVCSDLNCDWISDNIPTCRDDVVRYFNKIYISSNSVNTTIPNGYARNATLANGSSISINLTALPGYRGGLPYLLTTAHGQTIGCFLIKETAIINTINPDAGVQIAFSNSVITITNNAGSTIDLAVSIFNLAR